MFLPSNRLSGHLASKLKPSLTLAFIARCRIDQLRRQTPNEICQCFGIIHLAELPFGFAARLWPLPPGQLKESFSTLFPDRDHPE